MGVGHPRWDRMGQDELAHDQTRRLRQFLARRVLPFSPLYRERFAAAGISAESIRTFDDIAKIPFTTKQDLLVTQENPEGPRRVILAPTAQTLKERLPKSELLGLLARKLVSGPEAAMAHVRREFAPCSMFFTTGRSAGAIPFMLTRYDHRLLSEGARRVVDVLGVDPAKDRILNLFPYAPHLAFWQTFFCGYETGTLTLNTGGGRVMPADRVLGALERLKPTLVVGMPGYFYHLLRIAVNEKRDLSSIRLIALGGENVAPGLKRKVTSMLA